MKNKFFSLVIAFLLIVPCLFLVTACGGNHMSVVIKHTTDPGVKLLTVYDGDSLTGNSTHTYVGYKASEGKDKSGRIEKGKNYVVVIELAEGYDYGDLKLKVTGDDSEDTMHLDKMDNLLKSINNQNYTDFEDSTLQGVVWRVGEDAVNKIEVEFIGATEKIQYNLAVSNGTRTHESVANNEDLRMSLYIDNVALKNAEQQSVFTPEEFLEFVDTEVETKTFEYGQNAKIKVWFDGKTVPFNNRYFVTVYNAEYEYWDLIGWEDVYYDTQTGESVYNIDITKHTHIKLEWLTEYVENNDYDKVTAKMTNLEKQGESSTNYFTHAQIKDTGAVFTFDNFKQVEYDIIMKEYTNIILNDDYVLTQDQKEAMISYEDGVLSINAGKTIPIMYERDIATGKKDMSDGESENKYFFEVDVDANSVLEDTNVKTLKFKTIHNGKEFGNGYQLTTLPEGHRIEARCSFEQGGESIVRVANGIDIFAFDEVPDEARFGYGFRYYPGDVTEARHDLIERVTISDGENSFDVTVDTEDGFFIGTSTIEGLTLEERWFTITKAAFERIDTLTLTVYI